MKNTLFSLTNWMGCHPRRVVFIVQMIILIIVMTLAGVPAEVLAGPITSGS